MRQSVVLKRIHLRCPCAPSPHGNEICPTSLRAASLTYCDTRMYSLYMYQSFCNHSINQLAIKITRCRSGNRPAWLRSETINNVSTPPQWCRDRSLCNAVCFEPRGWPRLISWDSPFLLFFALTSRWLSAHSPWYVWPYNSWIFNYCNM